LVSTRLTQYLATAHFQLPSQDSWGDCHQNSRHSVHDRPLSLCKISAKSVQQFWRYIPNRQTDRQTNSRLNIRLYHEGDFSSEIKCQALTLPWDATEDLSLCRITFWNVLAAVAVSKNTSEQQAAWQGRKTAHINTKCKSKHTNKHDISFCFYVINWQFKFHVSTGRWMLRSTHCHPMDCVGEPLLVSRDWKGWIFPFPPRPPCGWQWQSRRGLSPVRLPWVVPRHSQFLPNSRQHCKLITGHLASLQWWWFCPGHLWGAHNTPQTPYVGVLTPSPRTSPPPHTWPLRLHHWLPSDHYF